MFLFLSFSLFFCDCLYQYFLVKSKNHAWIQERESGEGMISFKGHILLNHWQQVEENSLDLQHGQQTPLHNVCQIILICQLSCQAFADSHWWEATQVCSMQKIICSSWRSEEASADPHWREIAQMCTMQQNIQSSGISEDSPDDSRWSETPQMCTMQ